MPELLMKQTELLDNQLLTKSVIRLMKHDIFERFRQTRTLSDDDREFCDKIDWHPVDELPMKEEYVKELEKSRHEPSIPMTLEQLDELMGLK